MRSAEQMDGGLETAILGGAAKITEKGDFVFLSPLVGIYAEERSRMGVEIASQSSGWGRSFPADSACHRSSCVQQIQSLFLPASEERPTRNLSARAFVVNGHNHRHAIRRGDREVGFVAHKYRELTVPLVAGGTAVRSAWPGRMGPVEYYTRRSHARCREIAAADGVGSVRLLRVIRMRCRSAVPKPTRNPGDLDSPLFLWKSVN